MARHLDELWEATHRDSSAPARARADRLLHELCGLARNSGISAEQLLVLMKQRWNQHGGGDGTYWMEERDELARLVTRCIHLYFSGDRCPSLPLQ